MTAWTPVQSLSDEPQDSGFWQPWQPKIGQRVQIRLSGECNRNWQSEEPNAVGTPGHPPEVDRRTGTVVPQPGYDPRVYPHHPICVWWDGDPIVVEGIPFRQGFFAACELEPLE